MKNARAGLLALASLAGAPVASAQATVMQITVEPARPTATDDVVVRTPLPPSGCRLLQSEFYAHGAGDTFDGLVFPTFEPYGCPSDDPRLEVRVPLRVKAPGTYHVALWLVGGGSPTPGTPQVAADVTVGDAEWLVPAVARADGVNGARWTTDLEIFNTNDAASAAVKLTFLASGGSGA